MSEIKVRVASLTDVGRARELNEDSMFAGSRVFAVADGLGGHRAGEIASDIVVKSLEQLDEALDSAEVGEALVEAVIEANRIVYERQQAESDSRGMATTVTAIALDGARAHLAHVGDSRCYLIRDAAISQISQDHTLVARLVAEGKLTPEQAEYHPQRSIVTRALGAGPDVEVDTLDLELFGGDRLLICSDGLTAVLSDEELREFIARSRDLDATCKALVDEANARGGPDNITVVLLEVAGPRRTAAAAPEPTAAEAPVPAAPRPKRKRHMPVRLLVWLGAVLAVLLGGWLGVRAWIDGSWYVGLDGDRVAVFRGLPTDALGGLLHRVEEPAALEVTDVAPFYRVRLEEGLRVDDLRAAHDLIARIPRAAPTSGASVSPSPSPSPTPEAT